MGPTTFTGCSASITLSTAIKVTIVGGGKSATTIDCDGAVTGGGSLFIANIDTEIKDLTILDSGSSKVLSLATSMDLTLSDVLISGSGTISCASNCGDMAFTNVDVTLSTASAVYVNGATTVTVSGCHFYDISLQVGGSPNLYGGALHLLHVPSLTLHNSIFDAVCFAVGTLGGSATSFGGALSLYNVQGTAAYISGTDNVAGVGGFTYMVTSDMVWTNCTFSRNSNWARYGGGAFKVETCTNLFDRVTADGNVALAFPGAFLDEFDSDCTIQDSVVKNNFHSDEFARGAIDHIFGGTLTVLRCTFENNTAGSGADIAQYGQFSYNYANIVDSIFRRASANAYGGSLYMYWTSITTMSGCVFEQPYAKTYGGFVYLQKNSSLTVFDTVFSEGRVSTTGNSPAFFVSEGSTLLLTDVTIEDSGSSTANSTIKVEQWSTLGLTGVTMSRSTYWQDAITVTQFSSFSATTSVFEDGRGGGGVVRVQSWSTATLSSCSFTGNEVVRQGISPAVVSACGSGTTVALGSCVVSSNVGGPLVAATELATVTITSSSLENNSVEGPVPCHDLTVEAVTSSAYAETGASLSFVGGTLVNNAARTGIYCPAASDGSTVTLSGGFVLSDGYPDVACPGLTGLSDPACVTAPAFSPPFAAAFDCPPLGDAGCLWTTTTSSSSSSSTSSTVSSSSSSSSSSTVSSSSSSSSSSTVSSSSSSSSSSTVSSSSSSSSSSTVSSSTSSSLSSSSSSSFTTSSSTSSSEPSSSSNSSFTSSSSSSLSRSGNSSSSSSTSSETSSSSDSSSIVASSTLTIENAQEGLSTGAAVGISAAAVSAVVLIVILLLSLVRKGSSNQVSPATFIIQTDGASAGAEPTTTTVEAKTSDVGNVSMAS